MAKEIDSSTKKASSKKSTSTSTKGKLEEKLLTNLIELQKVHTDLAEKFNRLTNEISHLLGLFETAAKSFAKHPAAPAEKDKEFLEKIDMLLEQNKTIAKGLTLMEEKIRQNMYRPLYSAPRRQQEERYRDEFREFTPPMGSFNSRRPLPKF